MRKWLAAKLWTKHHLQAIRNLISSHTHMMVRAIPPAVIEVAPGERL